MADHNKRVTVSVEELRFSNIVTLNAQLEGAYPTSVHV